MSSQILEPGRTFDDFLIEDQIGLGGQGVVYRAKQISLDRQVAIKMLGAASSDPAIVRALQREAVTAAKLNHDNIARIYYIGQNKSCQYLVQEYVDGITLRSALNLLSSATESDLNLETVVSKRFQLGDSDQTFRVDFQRTLKNPTIDEITTNVIEQEFLKDDTSPSYPMEDISEQAAQLIRTPHHIRRCCSIVIKVAKALAHAHQHGVLHLDVKPENIMIGEGNEVRLIDFGLSRYLNEESRFFTSATQGTPHYLAPEQLNPRDGVDHRAEQFSLGLVLYELLTLRRAISAESVQEAMYMILTRNLPPVRAFNNAIPDALARVVHKATQKNPADRFNDMNDFVENLQRAMDNQPVRIPAYRAGLNHQEVARDRPVDVFAASIVLLGVSALSILLAPLALSVSDLRVSPWVLFSELSLIGTLTAWTGAAGLLGYRNVRVAASTLIFSTSTLLATHYFGVSGFDAAEATFRVISTILPAAILLHRFVRPDGRKWLATVNAKRAEYNILGNSTPIKKQDTTQTLASKQLLRVPEHRNSKATITTTA